MVLDLLIERKRVSDLVISIRDGRYAEQKSRLKKTRLSNIMYIVEGKLTEDSVYGLPISTVQHVLASMTVSTFAHFMLI